MSFALLASVFVIATCGLIYELIAGALASYLLGDSITQFSTIIGVYLFSMGIGSYLSRFFTKNLTAVFVEVEILVGVIGGSSAALLFLAFEHVSAFRVLLYGLVTITGTLVGLEIPILMRILSQELELKDLVSKVFTFDYVGALLASLLFPLVLVPHLGLVRSAFLFGMINVAIAFWALYLFKGRVMWARVTGATAAMALVVLGLGFAYSGQIMTYAETAAYPDQVIYTKSTPYQRIVLTNGRGDLRLFLNGNLQFSSRDEYRYHEALVHVGLAAHTAAENVLVLGGGDGLAVREILRYPNVRSVTLVDLDHGMTDLFQTNELLRKLNRDALLDPRVTVINADAFIWLKGQEEGAKWDYVVVDFPDPSNFSLGKLYSETFFRKLRKHVTSDGGVVVQSTSPFVARKSFWCVETTMQAAGFQTAPYHAYVPSFGEWGFIWGGAKPYAKPTALPEGLKFLSLATVDELFHFPPDMERVRTDVNKLNNQALVRYFEDEWSHYVQ